MSKSENEDEESGISKVENILEEISVSITDGEPDELVLSGDMGYHIFTDPNSDSPVSDISKILHEAFDRAIKDVYIDEEYLEEKYGEVTSENICKEIEYQLDEITGNEGLYGAFLRALAIEMEVEITKGEGYF